MKKHNARPLNTYQGHPKDQLFSGWMLMHPEQMARLFGMPFSKVNNEVFGQAKAKRLERMRSGQSGLNSAKKLFCELVEADASILQKFSEVVCKVGADSQACDWQFFLAGQTGPEKLQFSFLTDIEQAFIPVIADCSQGNVRGALSRVQADPLLCGLVSDEDIRFCREDIERLPALKRSGPAKLNS